MRWMRTRVAGSILRLLLLLAVISAALFVWTSQRLLADTAPGVDGGASAPSLAYAALGDSITAKQGYAPIYSGYVATDLGVPVTLTNLGLVGYTSGGLSYRLANDQTFRDWVRNADLITVMIGINDVGLAGLAYAQGTCGGADNQDCIRNTETSFDANFTTILSQIRAINGARNAVVLVADIYNPGIQQQTEDGTLGVFVPFVNQINADIQSISAANGISVADVYQAFNGSDGTEDPIEKGYIMPDGVHANEQGHLEIADQFRKLNSVLLDADTDGDGLSNAFESNRGTNPLLADTDGDSIPDSSDNCALVPNAGQQDLDLDALGDACDPHQQCPDFDDDGLITINDILIPIRSFHRPNLDGGMYAIIDVLRAARMFHIRCERG